MYELLRHLQGYSIKTRILVVAFLFIVTVVVAAGGVLYAAASGNPNWAATTVFGPLVFAILTAPIGVTLIIDLQGGGQDVVEAFKPPRETL